MSSLTSQITSLKIVYSTVYSRADQRKHQSSASLAFVWGIHRSPVNSPHKGPVTRKMFLFDDVIKNHNDVKSVQQIITLLRFLSWITEQASHQNVSILPHFADWLWDLDVIRLIGNPVDDTRCHWYQHILATWFTHTFLFTLMLPRVINIPDAWAVKDSSGLIV